MGVNFFPLVKSGPPKAKVDTKLTVSTFVLSNRNNKTNMNTTAAKPTKRPDYTGRRLPEPKQSDFPNFTTFILCAWALQGTSIDELLNFDTELTSAGRTEAGWILQGYIQQKFASVEQAMPFEHIWVFRLAETFDFNSDVDWTAIGEWVITQIEPRS